MQLLMLYVAHMTQFLTVEEVAISSVNEYTQAIAACQLLHQIKSFSFLYLPLTEYSLPRMRFH